MESDREDGKPSDHLTVVCEPLNVINNIPIRQKRSIIYRPIVESGLQKFGQWIKSQKWKQNKLETSVNEKVNRLYKSILGEINICFPEKQKKFTSDDSPWCSEKVKKLKRLKERESQKKEISQ